MKNKYLKIIPVLLIVVLVFAGYMTIKLRGGTQTNDNAASSQSGTVQTVGTDTSEELTKQEYFSARDLSGEIDTSNAIDISLEGKSISASSDAVNISGSTVTITKEGTYILSGSLDNGSVIVNTSKEEKVQLVLNGVSINSDNFAAIYVVQADKVFVTLAEGTENTLSNGGSFTQLDENNVDAVIFSKDDITLNGTGSLNINSPGGHGIVGKDEVTIANGNYEIDAAKTAIKANDSIAVADGTFNLTAGSDGLHAENNDDDSMGNIYIKGGNFNITVSDDGIHATTKLQIDGGTFNISAAEGLEATYIIINDGDISINASDDGINAAQKTSILTPKVEINGGNINIVMGTGDTDGVDSNGDIVINGGTVNVTGNSAFDYDGNGVINGGTVIVNGQEVSTLPNQVMGGHGGMGGQPPTGGMGGGSKTRP